MEKCPQVSAPISGRLKAISNRIRPVKQNNLTMIPVLDNAVFDGTGAARLELHLKLN
jgi:hypothetical protein